jgi:hypothetical protein
VHCVGVASARRCVNAASTREDDPPGLLSSTTRRRPRSHPRLQRENFRGREGERERLKH